MAKTTGDERFERYLREHGYDPGPHEPSLVEHGIDKRPDFLPRRGGWTVACEVKQFKAGASDLERRLVSQQIAAGSPRDVYGQIRRQVSSAASQLKPLTGLGIPLVAVLTNPERALVDLSVGTVLAALYGNITVTFPVDLATGDAPAMGQFEFDRDGKLTNDHPYLSAVVLLQRRELQADLIEQILAEERRRREPIVDSVSEVITLLKRLEREDLPDGDYLYVDVIETISDISVPLPEEWFDGERDSRWRINADGCFEAVYRRSPER